jgi:hypothetical protein
MKTGDLNIWLKACEQEILEIALRIEAIRKKVLLFTPREREELMKLKPLNSSLQGEIMNLRQLCQRINLKNIQLSRAEESLKKNSSSCSS